MVRKHYDKPDLKVVQALLPPRNWWTTGEVAEAMGVAQWTVQRLCRYHEVGMMGPRRGGRGIIVLHKDDVVRLHDLVKGVVGRPKK